MNKAERERLKHNEAADLVATISLFVAAHGRTIALAAVAVAIVIASFVGYGAWRARTEERAHAMLQSAIETAARPVAGTPAGASGADASNPAVFPTDAARSSAVIDQLRAVADAYPSTDAGIQARYYAASLLADASRLEEAAAEYEAVAARNGSSLLGRMATLGLASVQVRMKQFDPAIASLQAMSSGGSELPVDGVLMHLADAYIQAGRQSDAVETFRRVVNEFPQSPYASDARQRADALQVDVPKAS